MANILAVATLKSVSGDAKDDVQNTFAMQRVGADEPDVLGGLDLAIANFYNGISGAQANPLSNWISSRVSRVTSACELAFYDITGHEDGSDHGSPFATSFFTMGAPNGAAIDLPAEVAVCATLKSFGRDAEPVEVADNADPVGPDDADNTRDRPMQRATGRIYIGPLNHAVLDVTTPGRPGPTFRAALAESCVRLDTSLRAAASGPWHWSVWSRKREGLSAIGSVYVDDAFDTQRRRGPAKTTATVRAFPPL